MEEIRVNEIVVFSPPGCTKPILGVALGFRPGEVRVGFAVRMKNGKMKAYGIWCPAATVIPVREPPSWWSRFISFLRSFFS